MGKNCRLHASNSMPQINVLKVLACSMNMTCRVETKARDNENVIKAAKMRENASQRVKQEDPVGNDFGKKFEEQGPRDVEPGHRHNLLDQLRKGQDAAIAEPTRETGEEEMVRILNRKIRAEGLNGFVYEVLPDECSDQNESTYTEFSFSSGDTFINFGFDHIQSNNNRLKNL
jgi:hypothetical protein